MNSKKISAIIQQIFSKKMGRPRFLSGEASDLPKNDAFLGPRKRSSSAKLCQLGFFSKRPPKRFRLILEEERHNMQYIHIFYPFLV